MSNDAPAHTVVKPIKLTKAIKAKRAKGLQALEKRKAAEIKKEAKRARDAWKNAAVRRGAQVHDQAEGDDNG